MSIGAMMYTAALAQLAQDIRYICYRARRIAGETCLRLTADFGLEAVRFEERYQAERAANLNPCAPCAEERE